MSLQIMPRPVRLGRELIELQHRLAHAQEIDDHASTCRAARNVAISMWLGTAGPQHVRKQISAVGRDRGSQGRLSPIERGQRVFIHRRDVGSQPGEACLKRA